MFAACARHCERESARLAECGGAGQRPGTHVVVGGHAGEVLAAVHAVVLAVLADEEEDLEPVAAAQQARGERERRKWPRRTWPPRCRAARPQGPRRGPRVRVRGAATSGICAFKRTALRLSSKARRTQRRMMPVWGDTGRGTRCGVSASHDLFWVICLCCAVVQIQRRT